MLLEKAETRFILILRKFYEAKYNSITEPLKVLPIKGKIIEAKGTTNLFPKWHPKMLTFIFQIKIMIFLVKPICFTTTLIQGNMKR